MIRFVSIFLLCSLAQASLASGGVGGVGTNGGNYRGDPSPPRDIDRVYEYGKSLYLGRAPGSEKLKYCVMHDGKLKKLRGRSLKPLKGSDRLTFANALLDCDNPEQKVLLGMDKEQVPFVIYYLNKRHKLQLSGVSSSEASKPAHESE